MALHFNKYVQDGEIFVSKVAHEAGIPNDTAKAGRILRAVLHTFRNRLPVAESLGLISQLPMLIKAVYVDGWRINEEGKHIRRLHDFIESVREEGGPGSLNDFVTDYEVKHAIRAVFKVLISQISEGEIRDMMATLPEEIRDFLVNT